MRKLDITYRDEDDHKSGARVIDYEVGGDEVFIETWDWFDATGEFQGVGLIRKSDIPKLIAFLQEVN